MNARERQRGVPVLSWIGLGGMGLIALVRSMSLISPALDFNTDPLLDPLPVAGITPVGSILLDAVLMLASTLALGGEILAGRSLRWGLLMLALVPAVTLLWHGVADFDDAWRGLTWLAAMVGAVATAHAARDASMRWALAAMLAALMVPLVFRGAIQVIVEHGETVRFYREHRDAVLLAQGIEPGSSAAAIYERRLLQPEATGWFGLANVYASFMMAGLCTWLGLLGDASSRRLPSGIVGVTALVVGAAAVGLWWAGSRGAFAASALGIAFVALAWMPERVGAMIRRCWFGLACATIALVLLAVVIRGMMLPVGFAGEKSVLFRWHYMQGAASVIQTEPWRGVGADGFQQAYLLERVPAAPEEVASAHSVFIDWIVSAGILGAAWIILVAWLLWNCGRGVAHAAIETPVVNARATTARVVATVVVAASFAAMMLDWDTLDSASLLLRVIASFAAVVAALVAFRVLAAMPAWMCRTTLGAAAVALLAHGQIEMTLTQPGAGVAAWMLVGLAGWPARDASHPYSTRQRLAHAAIAMIPLILACVVSVLWLLPARQQQRMMTTAAEPLRAIGIERLEAGPEPRGGAFDRTREAAARRDAAHRLHAAYAVLPANAAPLRIAVEQAMRAWALEIDDETRQATLSEALSWASALSRDHPGPRSLATLASVLRAKAQATGQSADHEAHVHARREAVDMDPHGLRPRLALADALWDADRVQEARRTYEKALEIDAAWTLDELKRLSDDERRRVRLRVETPDNGS